MEADDHKDEQLSVLNKVLPILQLSILREELPYFTYPKFSTDMFNSPSLSFSFPSPFLSLSIPLFFL